MNALLRTIVIMVGTMLAASCATPQPVRDQASNTAALSGALEAELRAFRDVRTTIAKARLGSILQQERELARFDQAAAFEERAQRLAGQSDRLELMQTLRTLADSRREDDEAFAKRMADLEKALSATTTPISVPSEKISAVQKALSTLSEELSSEEWFKFVVGFAQQIHQGLEQEKDRATSTLNEAKPAPVQNEPLQ